MVPVVSYRVTSEGFVEETRYYERAYNYTYTASHLDEHYNWRLTRTVIREQTASTVPEFREYVERPLTFVRDAPREYRRASDAPNNRHERRRLEAIERKKR